jgi:hypothetical protein
MRGCDGFARERIIEDAGKSKVGRSVGARLPEYSVGKSAPARLPISTATASATEVHPAFRKGGPRARIACVYMSDTSVMNVDMRVVVSVCNSVLSGGTADAGMQITFAATL